MSYTQILIAFCMMAVFAVLFDNISVNRVVAWVEEISFEVYLYHYMFIVGPVSLMQMSKSWVINSILVIGITVIIASIMKQIETKITNINIKLR